MRNLLREYELKENLVSTDILFSDYIRLWLKTVEIRVDVVTLQGYEATAKTHILPFFDETKLKLKEVNHHVLQEYFNSKYRNGRKDGNGGLSPKTLRIHKNVINQTLKEAVKNNLISSNPCDNISLPKLERYDYQYYNAEQIPQFFEAIKDEPLYPLLLTTLTYGLRRSEVLGIKWDSVNLEANTLTIKYAVSKGTKTVEKNKTKNASSFRSFPITDEFRRIYDEARQKENANKILFGREYIDNDYVFKWENGKPYSPDYISHKFNSILKKYNLSHIRFHELRHSCASLLVDKDYSMKDVQEWLGHADMKMTANIYSHLNASRKCSMAQSMAKACKDFC